MIKLIEYGKKKLIPDSLISKDDRIFLSKIQYKEGSNSPCFKLQENNEGVFIKPLNYVGIIQLSNIKINIVPRFDNQFSKLIQIISFSNNLKYKYYKRYTKSQNGILSLHEIIIELLLFEINMIVKQGAFKKYVKHERNSRILRGRIDLEKQVSKNQLMGNRIYCKYDELDTNIIENQVILKALDVCRKITTNEFLLKKAKRYNNLFESYCDKFTGNNFPKITYHRLNYYYKNAHFYSKLIIDNIGASNLYKGKDKSNYILLLDMNELLEELVATLYSKYLSNEFHVKSQKRVTDAITDKNNNRYRDIIPDLYLENKSTGKVIIIDIKNKDYGDRKVYNNDIYQLAFYGMYFSDYFNESADIVIIFPKYIDFQYRRMELNLNSYKQKKDTPSIKVRDLDINMFLKLIEEESKNYDQIKVLLNEMLS